MSLLSQHLFGLVPQPIKFSPATSLNRTDTAIAPFLSAQTPQSQIIPVTPAAASSSANFPTDLLDQSALRDRGQHELQALLRVMQGIEPPEPKGEQVDLLVPRPTTPEP